MEKNNYIKRKNLSLAEFWNLLESTNEAESVRGEHYSDIQIMGEIITGFRDSTGEPFEINIGKLYKAYKELNDINTTTLKPYVNRVQSPALAILLASGILMKEGNATTEENKRKSQPIQRVPPKKHRWQSNIICPECNNYMQLTHDFDNQKMFKCSECGYILENPNYDGSPQPSIFSSKKFWKNVGIVCFVLFFIWIFYRFDDSNDGNITDGKLNRNATVEAMVVVKKHLLNSSSFEYQSSIDGIWDSSSNTHRYYVTIFYSATNAFGGRIDSHATVIFDKDGRISQFIGDN